MNDAPWHTIVTRAVRALVLVGSATVTLAGALIGYSAWRLRQGPITLEWLRPYVERRVDATWPDLPVRIGGLALVWHPERRRVELRAIDVHLRLDELGQELTLPAVAISPRWRPLLRGRLELHHLALIAPRLALLRTEQGITLGGTPRSTPAGAAGAPALTTTMLLENLHELFAVLGFIEVRDGEISIDDRYVAHTWRASQVQGRLAVPNGRVVAHLKAQLHSNALVTAASLAATEIAGSGIAITLNVDDVVPATLLDGIPSASRFKPTPGLETALRAVTSPISFESRLALRAPGAIDGPISVTATSSTFSVADSNNGLRLRDGKLALAAEIAPGIDRVQIGDSTIAFADGAVRLNGLLTRTGSESRLEVHAAVERLAVAALRHYWPSTSAPAARRWVTENVTAGVLKQASGTVHVVYGPGRTAVRVDAKALFDDVAVRFAPAMPPASSLVGSVSVVAGETLFTVTRGRLDALHVTGGEVRILPRQATTPAHVVVAGEVRGALARALAVLDHEPVGLARAINISPDEVGGTVLAQVQVTIPLDGKRLTYGGSAGLHEVALRRPINGWAITAGNFDIRAAGDTVRIEGKAAVAGVPASMDIHHDLSGSAPSVIKVQAALDAAARTALGIDPGDMVSGTIPISVTISPRRNAPTGIDVDADLTAARFTPPLAGFGKSAGRAGRASAQMTVAADTSLRVDRFDIDAGGTVANGSAARTVHGWQALRANVRVPQAGTQPGRGASVDVSAERQGDGFAFSLRSNDAGAVIDQLVTGDARDGTLRFDGTLRPSSGDTGLQGRLDVQDVHFVSAPVLARLLTLGSLSGLKRTMLRQGIHFDQIHADLDYKQRVVHITNGRAEGDAVSLLVSGSIDTKARRMDLLTHLIPSYYGLNRAPQKIPVLGRLVEKATGEAVQVIDARVHGSFDDPSVSVAHASMVAPEILKDQLRSLTDRASGKGKAR